MTSIESIQSFVPPFSSSTFPTPHGSYGYKYTPNMTKCSRIWSSIASLSSPRPAESPGQEDFPMAVKLTEPLEKFIQQLVGVRNLEFQHPKGNSEESSSFGPWDD